MSCFVEPEETCCNIYSHEAFFCGAIQAERFSPYGHVGSGLERGAFHGEKLWKSHSRTDGDMRFDKGCLRLLSVTGMELSTHVGRNEGCTRVSF